MEVELKHKIKTAEILEKIWNDTNISKLTIENTKDRVLMSAIYFDTPAGTLGKHKVALRIRQEGPSFYITYKGKGSSHQGLHSREEINWPIEGPLSPEGLKSTVLSNPALSEKLHAYMENQPLEHLLKMNFTRKKCQLKLGKSLFELALDHGYFEKPGRQVPFLELELELINGQLLDAQPFIEKLQRDYDLTPENKSKLEQGLFI